ncbi:tetratricopeptide repeat protein, partial [bacterium AH-315-C20]|nr:tetratricopeptide repeat protein [bacterium AH-315-C20]
MRKLLVISYLFSFSGFSQLTPEQEAQIDSLKEVIESAKHDTTIINAWVAWDNIIWISDLELDFELNEKIEALCAKNLNDSVSKKEEYFFLKSKASALNVIGILYQDQGDYASAFDYHTRSLTIKKKIGDQKGIASSLTNLGNIYRDQGDYASAIEYQTGSLTINEEFGNKKEMAISLNNIGNIYSDQGDYGKAIDYHTRSLMIREEIGDKQGIAGSLNNVGINYYNLGDYTTAIDYYTQSLTIKEEIGDKKGMATSLNSIGVIYIQEGDSAFAHGNTMLMVDKYVMALDYHTRSLSIMEEIGNKHGMARSLNNIGRVYQKQGETHPESSKREPLFRKAIVHSSLALSIAQEIGHTIQTRQAANVLYDSYKEIGKYQKSLEMHELYITMQDSITGEENQKEVIRHEFKYQYEKKALADSITHAKESQIKDVMLDKKQAQLKSEKTQRYALYGGLGLVGCLSFVLLRGFQRKKKDNVVISL